MSFPFFSPHLCPEQQGAPQASPGEPGLLQPRITAVNKTCSGSQRLPCLGSRYYFIPRSQAGLAALLIPRSPVASTSLAEPQGSLGSPPSPMANVTQPVRL